MATNFRRISIHAARRLFNEGKGVYVCPVKLRPGFPFNSAALVYGKEWLEKAERYRTHETLWKGTVEKTAWALMYNNWKHYNASYEAGYYAAFYVEV